MPGIVGVIAPRNKSELENWIDQMIQPSQRLPWHQVDKKIGSSHGLACVSLEGEAPLAHKDQYVLAFSGEIVGEDDLRAKLSEKVDNRSANFVVCI